MNPTCLLLLKYHLISISILSKNKFKKSVSGSDRKQDIKKMYQEKVKRHPVKELNEMIGGKLKVE